MNNLSSIAATVVRYPLGIRVGTLGPRPAALLELYDFEACPYCRKVREALTMLDLEVLVRPCPRGGTRFRPPAIALGGKRQFPLLIDGATRLYESDAIVQHLYARYGNGRPPLGLRLGPLGDAISGLASAVRGFRGRAARPSRAPARPLELWSFELSPYCRRVREVLTELELSYHLHNMGKDSPSRPAFIARSGKMMVPYLEDPNTDTKLFESSDIVRYLETTYAR